MKPGDRVKNEVTGNTGTLAEVDEREGGRVVVRVSWDFAPRLLHKIDSAYYGDKFKKMLVPISNTEGGN